MLFEDSGGKEAASCLVLAARSLGFVQVLREPYNFDTFSLNTSQMRLG